MSRNRDEDELDGPSSSTLSLMKTKLSIENGQLIRRNDAGGVVLRIAIDDLEQIRFLRPFNIMCLVFFATAAGIASIGYFVAEANALQVVLYIVALLIGMFGLLGMREDVIQMTTRGETIRFSSPDQTDEVASFVLSVQSLIGNSA